MSGTHEGGKKAAETAKERHGENFHEKSGSKGGQAANHGTSTKTQGSGDSQNGGTGGGGRSRGNSKDEDA